MAVNKIGHYTIVSELGRGGMGVVYKAHEESLNRFVAIKVLGEHLSEDPTFVARFVREAQAAAALSHPNIIQIFYIGEDQGRHYFVMEYVSGESLLAMVRSAGRIDNPRAAQYMLQAAGGLAAAHDKGFLHRDIKPANLMVDERGLLKIADFGLALPQDATTKLTATGMLMGTPGYLSPEQCMGQTLDQRTDIYSLGVTYYEILSGRMPFQADSPLALLRKILQEEPPDISTLSDAVDEECRRIVNRMIVKDREQRYPSCHELVADLEAYLASRGTRRTTAGLAGMRAAGSPTVAGPGAAATVQAQEAEAAATARIPSTPPPAPPATTAPMPTAPVGAPPPPPPVAVATAQGQEPAPVWQIAPPSAMVPAPQAAPVPAVAPAPVARKSKAPIIVFLALAAVFIVGVAAAAFFALRSPLIKRFLPWGHAETVAAQATTPESGGASSTTEGGSTSVAGEQPAAGSGGATSAASGGAAMGVTGGAVAPGATHETSGGGAAPVGEGAGTSPRDARVGGARSAHGGSSRAAGVGRPHRLAQAGSSQAAAPAGEQAAGVLSGVTVAVVGEQPLTGSVLNFLQSELQSAGLQPVDAATLPSTEEVLRGGSPSVGELTRALRGEGVATLVLARVERVGERELRYMGRSDIAYSSRVTLTCYDVATGRPRGRSQSAVVEYTSLNLDQATEKALNPLVVDIVQQAR